MILVVGLGNPGTAYDSTRHNIGVDVLDRLRVTLDFPAFRTTARLHAARSDGRCQDHRVVLARPETFMNDSGTAVGALLRFYQLAPEHLWVLHDDLDLPPGTFRASFDSRAGGHRGVQSIIEVIGTKAFHRGRFGIGSAKAQGRPADLYVLERPSAEEREALRSAIDDFLPSFVSTILHCS